MTHDDVIFIAECVYYIRLNTHIGLFKLLVMTFKLKTQFSFIYSLLAQPLKNKRNT